MALKKSKGQKALPSKLTLDFSGVTEGGGRSSYLAEGDYVFKVMGAVRRKKKDADSEYVSWQLKVVKGQSRGTLFHITSLKPEQLWSIRQFLEHLLGKEIPKKALNIDLDKYKGMLIGATVSDDDPYEGKDKSKIDATFPAAEYSEDEEDTKPEKAKKKIEAKKSKKTKDEDAEEEEDEDEEDEEESDDDEDEDEEEEEDEDELDVDDL